ncbi:MAG: hypothetical protein ACKON7_02150 [Planctomycetaceae bacterium]
MADDGASQPRPPMNVYTAMLVLSFVAIAIGCIFLALELFGRQLPLAP